MFQIGYCAEEIGKVVLKSKKPAIIPGELMSAFLNDVLYRLFSRDYGSIILYHFTYENTRMN
jgi:hypothetical protein